MLKVYKIFTNYLSSNSAAKVIPLEKDINAIPKVNNIKNHLVFIILIISIPEGGFIYADMLYTT